MMAEFKCISCGEIKDSEKPCSCPACGYRMFETPYDRKDILISEIENFISHFQIRTVTRKDLVFQGKYEDDKRFPDYDKILKYVTGRDRIDDFLNNLLETVEQLTVHFTAQFSKTYPVSFEILDGKIEQYDEVLRATLQVLVPGSTAEFPPVKWEKVSLLYAEKQNKCLWFSASQLINLIEKLAKKIVKFIKVNNLYGNNHKYHPRSLKGKLTPNTDYKDQLENAISETQKALEKKYFVDIADDGRAELKEMQTCLWHGIELIMCAPLFIKTFDYLTESGGVSEEELFTQVAAKLTDRYKAVNTAINSESLFRAKTEDEVFENYRKLISLDQFGFLVPVGTTLVNIGESEKKLGELIGLARIKESISKIKAY
ncbi:MAG: hypothetical protein GXY60_12490, partial [Spirochaetales bacterium]|nr:hypothetical protein [Spirochaetales bacterium]